MKAKGRQGAPKGKVLDKDLFEEIVAHMGEPICVYDTNFRILYQNPVSIELTGDHAGEFCYRVYSGRDEVCPGCPLAESFRDGAIHRAERDLERETGRLYFDVTTSAVKDRDGRITAGIEIMRDLTEKKKYEADLERVQKLESMGTLAGGIAHEFNNILTAIMGNISLAKMYTQPGYDIFDILTQAETASLRARNLTQQLLSFSGGSEPVKNKVSLPGFIKNCASVALSGEKAKLEMSVPEDLPHIEADEGLLSQAVNNVLMNAAQAMPQGGVIIISAGKVKLTEKEMPPLKPGDYVSLSIKDHGEGIPPENLHRIYDPFFTTRGKKSGLGLTIAYSVMQKHGGHISVRSGIGEGTVITMYLPASDGAAEPGADGEEKTFQGRGNVLVMEDEEAVGIVLQRMLDQCGFASAVAADGAEAIAMYKKAMESGRPYSAVILDLVVKSGMDGKDAIKNLLDLDPGAKAVVTSGYSNDPVMANYARYGFKGFLAKPYVLKELCRTLERVLMQAG